MSENVDKDVTIRPSRSPLPHALLHKLGRPFTVFSMFSALALAPPMPTLKEPHVLDAPAMQEVSKSGVTSARAQNTIDLTKARA
jgi:hypothetical protein